MYLVFSYLYVLAVLKLFEKKKKRKRKNVMEGF